MTAHKNLCTMVNARAQQHLFFFLACLLLILVVQTQGFDVPITYVQSAVAKGGVCMDGSPPAYHMDKGFGAGIDNWLVLLEGGGWCNNASTCLEKRDTRLGSSKYMVKTLSFSGILHNKPQFNPDFYNWNRIKVRYCDGSSFTGDVEAVNPSTKLYYRGQRVFRAVMDDLLAKGMSKAKTAMLSGCSAGGLAAILNCDRFRGLLPATAKVKCLADAGYFINAKAVTGVQHIERVYSDVVATHNSAKNLPQSCTSRLKPGLCFFPENVVGGIKTDLFLVNAAYDSWQIKNILAPGVADPHGTWRNCKLDITKCSAEQLKIMQGFRMNFLSALTRLGGSTASRGYFINSCYAHCQMGTQETWLRSDSPSLSNKTIGKAVGDWFYDRSPFQKVDCPYPCNKSCKNRVFDGQAQPDSIEF